MILQALPRRLSAALSLLALLAFHGCGESPTEPGAFTVTASVGSLSVVAGTSATVHFTVTRTGSFSGPVALSISGAPAGVTTSVQPATIGAGQTGATLTIAVPLATAAGGVTLNVTAASTELGNQTFTLPLTIVDPPSFGMSVAPATLEVKQGESGSITVTVNRGGGFAGAVTVRAENLPQGVTAPDVTIQATETTATLSLTAAPTATPGAATATVRATGSGVADRVATIPLTVAPGGSFGITAPPMIVVVQATTTPATVAIQRTGGFAGAVALSVDSLMAGLAATVTPDTMQGSDPAAVLRLTATIDARIGDTSLTIRGRAAGRPDVTLRVPVRVRSAVHSVEIVPAFPDVPYDGTKQLAAVAKTVDGQVLVGRRVAWTQGDGEHITVADAGGGEAVVTGIGEGQAPVFALVDSTWGTTMVTVGKAPVARVEIAGPTKVNQNGYATLSAKPFNSRDKELFGRTVRWSSADASVATIDSISGEVNGIAIGKVVMTATIEGTRATVEIEVVPAPLGGIWIDPDIMEGRVGQTGTFTAEVYDQEGNTVTGRTVKWEISDSKVATIDGNTGVVTLLAQGQAVVRAYVADEPTVNETAMLYVRPASGWRLETFKAGDGTGTISVSPVMEYYPPGTEVTLTATPTAPSFFGGWSNACAGMEPTCTVVMNSDLQVGYSFRNTVNINVSILGYGLGIGTVDRPSSGPYAPGTTVPLTAVPAPYSKFRGWVNDDFRAGDCTGTNPVCTLTTGHVDLRANAGFEAVEWKGTLNGSYEVTRGECTYVITFSEGDVVFTRNHSVGRVSVLLKRSAAGKAGNPSSCSGGSLHSAWPGVTEALSGDLLEGEMKLNLGAPGSGTEYIRFRGQTTAPDQPFAATFEFEFVGDPAVGGSGKGSATVTLTPQP